MDRGFMERHPEAPVALLKAYRCARDVAFDRIEGSDPVILTISWAAAAMAEQRELMGERRAARSGQGRCPTNTDRVAGQSWCTSSQIRPGGGRTLLRRFESAVRKQETGRSSRIADPEADDVGMWCSTDPRRATQVLAAPPACTHTPHGSSAPINVSGDSTATTQARPRIPMSAHHTASTTSSQRDQPKASRTGILLRRGRPARSKPARPRMRHTATKTAERMPTEVREWACGNAAGSTTQPRLNGRWQR
jgi:hypothetical protein